MSDTVAALIELSHQIGREDRAMAILGEGNTSARLSDSQFAVKASGSCLRTLRDSEVTVCHTERLVNLLHLRDPGDEQIEREMLESRADPHSRKPSLEAVFHAWLLTLDGVGFVGHCHPLAANQVLCSPRARDFAERRLFPDEVVYCGPASVFVPYCDPGLPLAREIRERTKSFIQQRGIRPRLIVLQNHGIIALGSGPGEVLACLEMATKAAAIFMGSAALGGPNFLTPDHVQRISGRADEAYRQKQI